ncbi:MAG: PaaI family thioesterase [Clostridia bacterium]|nr:PaaI family thioesterase [Clostridia bacterium]
MKVTARQGNSKNCIICGMENEFGLKAPFYNLEDGSVASIVEFKACHQSYPERTHGGMVATLLDELMGRVLWYSDNGQDDLSKFAVTMSMTVKYRKPTPYDKKIKARAYYIKDTARAYVCKGEIYDFDNNLLAEAEGTYFKMSPSQVVSNNYEMAEEMCYHLPLDINEIDFPEKTSKI